MCTDGDTADFFGHVWRFLIDQVQPVMIEDMGIAAPNEARRVAVVVVRIVVGRRLDRQTLVFITPIFLSQCIAVVFEMAEDEETAMIGCADDVDAVFRVAG